MAKRIFINNLNTYIGQALFNELRNDTEDNEDPNLIFGTYIEKDSSEKPAGVKKMLKRSKPRLAMKYISECDIIIYDLHAGNPKDIEMATTALKKYNFETEKVLILVSSVMMWKNTQSKLVEEKPETAEQPGEEEAEEGASPEEAPAEPAPPAEEQKYPEGEGAEGEPAEGEEEEEKPQPPEPVFKNVPYEEGDFAERQPPAGFEDLLKIENELLEFKKENLKVYVVCAGVPYGNGETVFNEHFRSAWLQTPSSLSYLEDGENLVPSIHVVDLARFVKTVCEKKPEQQQYLMAIDCATDRRQKTLVESISKGIGTGEASSIPKPVWVDREEPPPGQAFLLDQMWQSTMLLNLNTVPSALLVGKGGEEEAPPEFDWHCRGGLSENIATVKEEFCKVRHLKPIKIFVTGPPLSGKSFFGAKLAQNYNIPHVHIKTLITAMESHPDENHPLRVQMAEFKRENPNDRYPDEIVNALFQHRLKQNDCQHRGFVLDGYPRSYKDAKGVFVYTPPKKEKPVPLEGEEVEEGAPEDPEEDENARKPVFLREIYPDSVILLMGSDNQLKEKARTLPSDVVKGSHYFAHDMERRLKAYNDFNSSELYAKEGGELPVVRYFQELKTEILELGCVGDEFEMLEDMRIYVERHGRPYNYLPSAEEIYMQREKKLLDDEERMNFMREEDQKKMGERKEHERSRLENLAGNRMIEIGEHVKELEEALEMNQREFLMKNVVPFLTEGMVEVCKVVPLDPIDYLAEYIFKKSNNLKAFI